MNLRLRLIVVFFLLSVVPVGAITYYTYRNNAQAIRDAAGFEATQLAGELSQRMSTVTAQLSQRVESLMEIETAPVAAPTSAAASPTTLPATTTEPRPGAAAGTVADATAAAQAERARFEAQLGENFAAMLKNITIVDGRGRRGGRRGGGGPPPGTPDGTSPARGGDPASPPSGGPSTGDPPVDGRGGRGSPGDPGNPDGRRFGPGRGSEPDPDPTRIRIDLGRVRGEVISELIPDRQAFDALPLEERQRTFAQIDQRMRGVQQGIDVLRTELESRAVAIDEIRTQAANGNASSALGGPPAPAGSASPAPEETPTQGADGPATNASAAGPPSAVVPPATTPPVATAPPAPVPAAPSAPVAPAPVAPPAPGPPVQAAASALQRSTELSGRRFAVRLERDGQIVGEVGADIDLPMLLAEVFQTTSRDRGEVPFAVGQDGELFAPSDTDKVTLEGLQMPVPGPDAAPGTTIFPDWIVATTPDPIGAGLTFGIARPVGDALRELQQTSARNAALGLAFIGLALVAIVPLSGRLTRNLDRLSDGVNRIAQGEYSARVQVRSHDEVGRLAQAFNQMAADVEKHQQLAVGQERIRRELELGRQIQHDMLPRTPLRLGLTEVKGVSVPAREVGGDFFNYFQLQDGTIALLVGDVSGKGVGAALLMANIQAALRTRLSLGQDLASLAQELDVDIDSSTPGPVYATLFVGILDPVARLLRCVNAGHNPQYVLRAAGQLDRMESTGRPIGLYSGGGYTEQQFELAAGDVLFFYTDGCVEAENGAGEMFGSDRLEHILSASAGRLADEVIVAVEADVSRFRAGVELQDDATMMVVKVG